MNLPILSPFGLLVLLSPASHTQGFGPQQLIAPVDETPGANSAYAADLDGDGDMDVLFTSKFITPRPMGSQLNKTAWYENYGGGRFGPQRMISSTFDPVKAVAARLDSDDSMDIVSASYHDQRIDWFSNVSACTSRCTLTNLHWGGGIRSVVPVDLDGDSDVDILANHDSEIFWLENDPGDPSGTNFNPTRHTIAVGVEVQNLQSVFPVDLDGDGDADVLSASEATGGVTENIAWYENLGGGSFGLQQVIETNLDAPRDVCATDLDLDGDEDVLVAFAGAQKIVWYENLEDGTGLASFGPHQDVALGLGDLNKLYLEDLNGDGYQDLVFSQMAPDRIDWLEFVGLGNGDYGSMFMDRLGEITTSVGYVHSLHAEDLDGDGDMDVLSASPVDHKVAWYENLSCANDCNNNGVTDCDDIAAGTSTDCDLDGTPDECTVVLGAGDCNINGVHDVCEIQSGAAEDCNGNQIPEECEGLPDCNGDGTPDECDMDCNGNGVSDICDIMDGSESDLNNNDVPDSCECHWSNYCGTSPNSVGSGVSISVSGIPSVSLNQAGFEAQGGPANQPGLFFHGPGTENQPFGEGVRCVSTPIIRISPPVFFGGDGNASKVLDMTSAELSSIQPADTRYFQLWYRDPTGGPFGWNLSNGLEVTFCP